MKRRQYPQPDYSAPAASAWERDGGPLETAMWEAAPSTQAAPANPAGEQALRRFIQAQHINAHRDLVALRAFQPEEFGSGATSPSRAHIVAVNELLQKLRQELLHGYDSLESSAQAAAAAPQPQPLQHLLRQKELMGYRLKRLETAWQFYLELFTQRQTPFARLLLATDRIALDCYQVTYTGLGQARSIPAPPPFSYMETGHSPATFRRGVVLTRLSQQQNPFPIVSLPYHRLHNPWTLGAVHHEVAHNIQSDLGLWEEVPRRIRQTLLQAGFPPALADLWARWHKEIWADLCGTLLGGPAVVVSLLDVLARGTRSTASFNPAGVHPTPLLRAGINFHLLRRMGYGKIAERLDWLWQQLYPHRGAGHLPPQLLESFPKAVEHVVEVICYQPYAQLGQRALCDVVVFKASYLPMIEEAAQRLAHDSDPGIIPERFLVGAARAALEKQLASPGRVKENFYRALARG